MCRPRRAPFPYSSRAMSQEEIQPSEMALLCYQGPLSPKQDMPIIEG